MLEINFCCLCDPIISALVQNKQLVLLKLTSSLRSSNTDEFSQHFGDSCYVNIHQQYKQSNMFIKLSHYSPPLFVLPFVLQLFSPIVFAFASILYFPSPFISPLFGYNTLLF